MQQTTGAPELTLASPVASPTASAPNTSTRAKNFSLTSALSGAVYQVCTPRAIAAKCAPVADQRLPEPVGVDSTTLAPEKTSMSASSCAG